MREPTHALAPTAKVADGAGQIAEVHVSRTDKTRPWRVKLLDDPANYREVHNHGKRPLYDADGNAVLVPIEGEFWRDGRQKLRRVEFDHPGCDLPPDPRVDTGKWQGCHWTYTAEWAASGQSSCCCKTCSMRDWNRQENRKKRLEGKRQARDWQREY